MQIFWCTSALADSTLIVFQFPPFYGSRSTIIHSVGETNFGARDEREKKTKQRQQRSGQNGRPDMIIFSVKQAQPEVDIQYLAIAFCCPRAMMVTNGERMSTARHVIGATIQPSLPQITSRPPHPLRGLID
jgi:hypothetical protein